MMKNIQSSISKLYNVLVLLLVFSLAFLFACNDSEDIIVNEYLVSSTEKFSRSVSETSTIIELAGFISFKDYLKHDITIYEITYQTDYLGETITASGLVTFPNTEESVPMMSFQHGTIVAHSDAPSEDSRYTLLSGIASAGYIFLVPDMIGFGSSTDKPHPYYHQGLTASSIMDMIKAAKELAIQKGYNFNGELFLSGYSEGGYATMATHKAIEENPIPGIDLIASAPASGGYDVKGMQEYFFSLDTYDQPFYIAYVALTYHQIGQWVAPLSTYFNEPYASNLPDYFDGTIGGAQINGLLTDVIVDLLQPNMLANFETSMQFSDMRTAFEENSVDDWKPTTRMIMYHGTADITVPYQNSVDTYETFITNGASSEIVTFLAIQNATHSTGVNPYIQSFVEEFEKLK